MVPFFFQTTKCISGTQNVTSRSWHWRVTPTLSTASTGIPNFPACWCLHQTIVQWGCGVLCRKWGKVSPLLWSPACPLPPLPHLPPNVDEVCDMSSCLYPALGHAYFVSCRNSSYCTFMPKMQYVNACTLQASCVVVHTEMHVHVHLHAKTHTLSRLMCVSTPHTHTHTHTHTHARTCEHSEQS